MKIFIEASGSLVAPSNIISLKEAKLKVVASDITSWNAGSKLTDEYVKLKKVNSPNYWNYLTKILLKKKINWVIPSLDETLRGWSLHESALLRKKIKLLLSPKQTIYTFTDKWLTYNAFCEMGLPTPKSSQKQIYDLVKPRFGRGSKGIVLTKKKVSMRGMISQKFLYGNEITIDCLFDKNGLPIYIIPRIRKKISNGKSISGRIIKSQKITKYIKILSEKFHFVGPINVQCFEKNNEIKFTEINPRISGGLSLSMKGSENWFDLWFNKILKNKPFLPKKIKYGMEMDRYYMETFNQL